MINRAPTNLLFVNAVYSIVYNYLVTYKTPSNINIFWNFGSLAGLFLGIQIISGFFLTMFYTPHIDYAFDSVEHLMRDVNYGWFIRYMHSNGASFFFLVVYIHMFKGLYYASYRYPRTMVWFSGVIIYILMMGAAFLGYVLPWGQMSYWAATVITNFVTVVPFIGKDLVCWIWGGFSINNATLNRFYSLHFILPFVIALVAVYHLFQLHKTGSSNPLGVKSYDMDKIPFYPYFILKDLLGFMLIFIPFFYLISFYPDYLSHSDNYIRANPLVTPPHIVPEWYFLPFYGILRSISDKTYGIIMMFLSLISFFFFPYLDKKDNCSSFDESHRDFAVWFSVNFIFLGYLGSENPVYPIVELGLLHTHLYLLYIYYLLPYMSYTNLAISKIRK